MEVSVIQLSSGAKVRSITADEGKLLYLAYELEELGDEAHGAPNAIVPLEIDHESLYIEKEIDIFKNDESELIEK